MLRNKLHVYGPEKVDVPSHLHYGKDMLDRILQFGDQPALINVDNGEVLTFRQLAQKTVDVALSLTRMGVRKGDVVSTCTERRIELIPTVLGVICIGAVYSPTVITYGHIIIQGRMSISRPKVMFLSPKAYELHKPVFDTVGSVETYIIYGDEEKDGCVLFKHFLTETGDVADFVPTPVDGWKDLALIFYSSGTTGPSKGVPWTHLALLLATDPTTSVSFNYPTILITREWYYAYGLAITLRLLKKGITCFFTLSELIEDHLRIIQSYKVKMLQSLPSYIDQLTKLTNLESYDVTSLEGMMSATLPLVKDQVEAVKKRFPSLRHLYQFYAMSETGGVCNSLLRPPKDGSVGTVCPGVVVKVVDIETREALGANRRGEICVKSHSLMRGYLDIDGTDHLDSEGFYKTGDVGYYDDEQYFYVVNRVTELIKYKSTSIFPTELETILTRDARVREAGVAAVGEVITALVVLQPDAQATPQDIIDYFHSQITSPVKLEGGVYFVAGLPRGAGDKLDRRALHDMLTHILATHT